jgi:hypothetical protein
MASSIAHEQVSLRFPSRYQNPFARIPQMWAYEFTYKKRLLFVGLHHEAWGKPPQSGMLGAAARHKTSEVSRRAREVLGDRPAATWCVAFWPGQEPEVWCLEQREQHQTRGRPAPARRSNLTIATATRPDSELEPAPQANAPAAIAAQPIRGLVELRRHTVQKWRLSRQLDGALRQRLESLATSDGRMTMQIHGVEELAAVVADGLQLQNLGLLQTWRRLGTRTVPAEITMELTHAGWNWLQDSH